MLLTVSGYRAISGFFLIQCILFLVPVNILIIGDWLATGVQWGLFRYIQSYIGNSLIFFTNYITYIANGRLTGRSALAAGFDIAASACLILALCILLFVYLKRSAEYVQAAAIVAIAAGCLFLLADMIQYGVLFSGPAGFAIPIGVPVILVCGWWMYRMEFAEMEENRADEEAGSENTGTA
ncbi:MAG: hypothetical protein LUQ31_01555 [Methanoregula sp.]|nr:hypothetical protein [Methanoregula sp.]